VDGDVTVVKPKGAKETGEAKPVPDKAKPVMVMKHSRGRLGGTTALLTIAQRAMWHGRDVQIIDGDLKSQTLMNYYPPGTKGGAIVPTGSDVIAFKDLMLEQMDQMVADGVSRVVDVSGGARDIEGVIAELDPSEFCRDNAIGLLMVCMLGPDLEDFRHLMTAVDEGQVNPADMLIVFNEGVLRGGNPDGAFLGVIENPRFVELTRAGAQSIFMRRLSILDRLREARANLYEVASGRRHDGTPHSATQAHMTKKWLDFIEQQCATNGLVGRLP
jgi:hypothetical protein